MKISLLKPPSAPNGVLDQWVPEFEKRGVEVLINYIDETCDFILCSSHSQTDKMVAAHKAYPDIPIINYHWDIYEWHKKQHYDWDLYGKYLAKSIDIWCPSEEVILRTEEYFGLGSLCHIIKTFARFFEYDDVQDKRYVFQPMRAYHHDRNYGWTQKACKELGIPLVESMHKLSQEDFEKTIAHCSFLLCEYYEASTGGLTLLEGHRLGKEVLVCDSDYMGARDYFGDRAHYFKHDDYEDFKKQILHLWDSKSSLDRQDCEKFTDQYSLDLMVDKMTQRLHFLKDTIS